MDFLPQDEPASLWALGIAVVVLVERTIERVMRFLEKRRNGGPASERGAVGPNGLKAITERLERMEHAAAKGRRSLWTTLGEVKVTCGRLDERLKNLEKQA